MVSKELGAVGRPVFSLGNFANAFCKACKVADRRVIIDDSAAEQLCKNTIC